MHAIAIDSLPAVAGLDVALTGDRPTGRLHVGHLCGSLRSRLRLQDAGVQQFVMIADLQALTDNAGAPARVSENVLDVALDYLAVGLVPARTTIVLQSAIPELAEMAMLYLNLVTVARLERNPTVREEIRLRGFERSLPAGFLAYPAAQAADITGFEATVVPVGADQLPMIEQSNEIAAAINRLAGRAILPAARALLPEDGPAARLPGADGKKMSKSSGNAIGLADSPEEIRLKVMSMFTDPGHLRVDDPGTVEGNVVFTFLDVFDVARTDVADLKERYRAGGLGDVVLKRRLDAILQDVLAPIRSRRMALAADPAAILQILREGTRKGRAVVAETLSAVRGAFGIMSL
jgi:tryptophanyl-tRNA synthetase